MTQNNFGRRQAPVAARTAPPLMKKVARPPQAAVPLQPSSVDEELAAWKKSRGFRFPLKPLALMASLCFGIASFVLPDSVNDWLQWPLYALSAGSLFIGFRRKS